MRRRLCLLSFVGIACCPALAAIADDGPEPSAAEPAMREAASHMRRLKLLRIGGTDETVELIDHPLLSFGDSTRATNHGTLWAWGNQGRPVAFLELYQIGGVDGNWFHALSLASEPNVALVAPSSSRWQPRATAFKLARLNDAPAPAAKEAARLRQLKDIARRFTGHEFWDPDHSRYELRLLPHPVHWYGDPNQTVHDGAVFAFVHGTNPEGLLLIEATGNSLGSAGWEYALLRSADAELHIELDGREVWTCDRAVHTADGLRKPYCVFLSALEPDTRRFRPAGAE